MKTVQLFCSGPGAEEAARSSITNGEIIAVQKGGFLNTWEHIFPALRACTSDLVLFYDHKAAVGNKLEIDCALMGTEVGMIYPEHQNFYNPQADIQYAPVPYFICIDRELLLESLFELEVYKTMEFRLFHLYQRMKPDQVKTVVSQAEIPDYWISQRMLKHISDFAMDLKHLVSVFESSETVPAQFRISTVDCLVDMQEHNPDNRYRPRFSVLCPVFKPDFLEEMINSVCQQTWTDWELILGVDGPPEADRDRIMEVVQGFEDFRIRCYEYQNEGTGPTREKLRRLATGDYIISIDDDDMLVAPALEVFARVIRNNPEIRAFRGGSRIFGLTDQELVPGPRYTINGISNDPFEVNQPYVIESGLLKELGGFEWDSSLHNAGEDTYLFHKLDKLGVTTGLVPLPLYMRRLSTRNLTLEFEAEQAMAHFDNIDHLFGKKDWKVTGRHFDFEGNFQRYTVNYLNEATGEKLMGASRFFQYQTLGDLNQLTIDLEVTSKCNAVCGFCPREAMPDKKTNISLATVSKLADYIGQFPGTQVVLCGIGESLLHPQLLDIVRMLKEAGAIVAMTSNGALMKPDKFRQLVEAGLTNFNFSVNAFTADTHREVMGMKNFDRVMSNVTAALQYQQEHKPGVRVHVSCVVCDKNESEVHDFVAYWKSQGATQVWLHPINNRAGLLGAGLKSARLDEFDQYYQGDPNVSVDIFKDHEEGEHLCKIAKSLAFISSDGEMRLCAMDYARKTSHGNIRYKTLQQMQFEKLKSFIRGNYDDFCSGCDFCPPGMKKENPVTLQEV